MQNALQNPHYKKIWEKVIMNKRPEVKTLEEALEMEGKEEECYILQYENSNPQMHAVLEVMRGDYPFYEKFQILGRPITLSDILNLLNKLNEQEDCCFVFDGRGIYKTRVDAKYNHSVERICDFKTNLLCETTPETWEKIANLI